jgi:hypothetical protein
VANAPYLKAKKKILDGDFHLLAGVIKASLIDFGAYTPNMTLHEFFSDVPGAAVIATATLTGKNTDGGVFDAADTTMAGVTGPVSEGILLWEDSGAPATSPLLALIDTATGLPVSPNSGDIVVQWDNGPYKILALTG